MISGPFAALEERLARLTTRRCGNVVVQVGEAAPFVARLGVRDINAFEGTATVGDLTLRYLLSDAPDLVPGTRIVIDEAPHLVQTDPDRIDAYEAVVVVCEVR